MNWVIVRSFGNRVEAELAVAMLDSCGIKAMVNGDDQGNQNAFLAQAFGVNVLTLEEHRSEAAAILDAAETFTAKKAISNPQVNVQQPKSRRVKILLMLSLISWSLQLLLMVFHLELPSLMLSFVCCFITFEYLRQSGKERSRQRLMTMDAEDVSDEQEKNK